MAVSEDELKANIIISEAVTLISGLHNSQLFGEYLNFHTFT